MGKVARGYLDRRPKQNLKEDERLERERKREGSKEEEKGAEKNAVQLPLLLSPIQGVLRRQEDGARSEALI